MMVPPLKGPSREPLRVVRVIGRLNIGQIGSACDQSAAARLVLSSRVLPTRLVWLPPRDRFAQPPTSRTRPPRVER